MKRISVKPYLLAAFFCISPLLSASDAFTQSCIPCHTQTNVSLQKTFMNALLVYGGRENMKAGLLYFFQNPSINTSVMDEDFIRKNGIKKPLKIEKKLLDEALDIYWERYTVIGKLK